MLESEILPIPPPTPAISQLYIILFETNKTELFIICRGFLWKVLQPQLSLETSHVAYFIFFNDFMYIYLITNPFIHMMLLFFLNCKECFVSFYFCSAMNYIILSFIEMHLFTIQTELVLPTIKVHSNSNTITHHTSAHANRQCSGRRIEASFDRT